MDTHISESRERSRTPRSHRGFGGLTAAALLLVTPAAMLAGCSGGDTAEVSPGGGVIDNGSTFFFGDPNFGGQAQSVRLTNVAYGRLVQLFGLDFDGRAVAMGEDFVIGQSLVTNDDYRLERNPVTGAENLTIISPNAVLTTETGAANDAGRQRFLELVEAAGRALDPIQVQDLTTSGVFSMLPRNSTMVLTFDDLLAPSTIDNRTIQIVTGLPPSTPFSPRVIPSQYFGGSVGGTFYPTRVALDMTVSEIEAASTIDPPPINGVGLPPSLNVDEANAQLRIATRTFPTAGITRVLSNLTDHQLSTTNNGPVDLALPTQPVTRAMRTGGRPDLVSDPFNGFLLDEDPPVVVGSTPLEIPLGPIQQGGTDSLDFIIPTVRFSSNLCGTVPEVGNVISQAGVFAEVAAPGGPIGPDGSVSNLEVRLLRFPSTWTGPEQWTEFGAITSTFETAFETGTADDARAECFVQISPLSAGFPENPSTDIKVDSRFTFRFSEPMDPLSLTAFDSLTVTRSATPSFGNLPTSDYVVGRVTQTSDLRTVTFSPDQFLAHETGTAERYFISLADFEDSFPPRDLAGNVVESFPEVPIDVDREEANQFNGGRVSRFTSIDEEPPFDSRPEWGGQFLVDNLRELIRPRPVVRSQVAIDNEQPLVAQMTPFNQGVVTPLSNFGSKMQTIWRYADCGFSLTDVQNINIDVEGLYWEPSGGVVTPDGFSEFEISLGHSRWAPDEVIDPQSLFPNFQNSGLRANYGNNRLPNSNVVVVHNRQDGYMLDPGELVVTAAGTPLMPFPANRNVDTDDLTFFTWRDTSIRDRAGTANGGVEPQAYLMALNQPVVNPPYYRSGQVQSIGLPLLMEYRTYPDPSAVGLNAWVLNLAVNSSSRPYFRAFSTGGVNQSGTQVLIDPDAQNTSNGGYTPASTPPGDTTFGRDNSVHRGAIDYVTRISRAHSIWFPSTIESEGTFTSRVFNPPTVEPNPADQPPGTEIDIDFRGALSITYLNNMNPSPFNDHDTDDNGITDYLENAFTLDLYGDYYNEVDGALNHDTNVQNIGLTFIGTSQDWQETVDLIDDSRFYQVRLTFIGNPVTTQIPELSAFAITWAQN